jgi:hypothetical protein
MSSAVSPLFKKSFDVQKVDDRWARTDKQLNKHSSNNHEFDTLEGINIFFI